MSIPQREWMMSNAETGREKSKKGCVSHRLGMAVRHLREICKRLSVEFDRDGNPNIDRLAEALSFPELPERFKTKQRAFVSLRDAAVLLGVSPGTVAKRSSQRGGALRRIRVGPRISYFYAPDLDELLFGSATEIPVAETVTAEQSDPSAQAEKATRNFDDHDMLDEDIAGLLPAMRVPTKERRK